MTDPIADMLTRIRNALIVKHASVEVPASNMKKAIAKILLDEGYIAAYDVVEDGVQGKIVITLKYGPKGEKVINGLKRVSKPGQVVLFSPASTSFDMFKDMYDRGDKFKEAVKKF